MSRPSLAQRALPLEPGHEVVREGDALEGGAEHELAGVEDEGALLLDLDELGEVLLPLLRVDEGRGVVAEDTEVPIDVEIDRRGLDRVVAERFDHDAAGGELFAD